MSTFLKLLPLELQDTTEYIDPESASKKEDSVVGTMSDDSKKLYTLWRHMEKRCDENMMILKHESPDNKEEVEAKLRELKSKADLLRELFWIGIKDEMGLWAYEGVGVRHGFTVVTLPPSESGPERFFRGMGMFPE